MLRYYLRVSGVLLPHLKDRPLTFTRYPNGIHDKSFYQKHWDQKLPEFVETVRLFSSHNEGDGEYILVSNLPTLVWLAQLASIELHPWLSRTSQHPDATHLDTTFTGSRAAIDSSVLNYPDFIVFDLDPYIYSGGERPGDEPELNRRAFSKATEVARALRGILDQLSLSSFLKTSGKTGLHIYVPILRQYDYPVTRKTCELVGRFLMQQLPRDVTMEWTVARRSGHIFLDHNQNVRTKNMASVYSLRPAPGAPVSTPLRWDELDRVYPSDFSIETVPERVETTGDLWAGILEAKHDLRRLLEAAV
jgi:bifunctional non-homologous end joining protein LigD